MAIVKDNLKMYFLSDVARNFAALEQNDKNFRVAAIVDRVLMYETKTFQRPLHVAELGGGAHPDRYHQFFAKLLTEPKSCIDWVDVSPYMINLAKEYIDTDEYRDREKVIRFIQKDISEYLEELDDQSLDCAIMKYTFDYIEDIEKLFCLFSKKLKKEGILISTIGNLSPELKSYSTNARYFYNGEAFPDNETRQLKEGDKITIKFFKTSGDPQSGHLEGAETTTFYRSEETIRGLATAYHFDIFLGNWKNSLLAELCNETLDQNILILRNH
ncbi:MAG: class I SAM-dependent methyltransferase [bacterium]